MESTTDNNLNDNRIREKKYEEYLLRACRRIQRAKEKSEKWKEGTREKESVLLTALSRTTVCTNITFVEKLAVILAARTTVRHRAGEMISRIFPGHINSRYPTGAPANTIKIFMTAKARARHNA